MESSLECEVCMVAYNSNEHRPRFLQCGHSMCSSCIKETLRTCNSKLTCPFCRTQCGTGVRALDDFPTAFALLNLLDNTEQKKYSGALSPIDKENKVYLEKKQSEYDCSVSHISNCNEHLEKLLHSKEIQEAIIRRIEKEQKELEDLKDKVVSIKDQLDVDTATGIGIMNSLQVFQDSVKYSSNLSRLNETIQDGNKYYTASKEWIASTADSITFIKDDTLMAKLMAKLMEDPEHGISLPQKETMTNNTTSTTTSVSTTAVNTTTTSSASTRTCIIPQQEVPGVFNPIRGQSFREYDPYRGRGRQQVNRGYFNTRGYNSYRGRGQQQVRQGYDNAPGYGRGLGRWPGQPGGPGRGSGQPSRGLRQQSMHQPY